MCALFGWLDYKGIIPYKTLKKLTQALANAAEERGKDASGISYIKDGKVTIYCCSGFVIVTLKSGRRGQYII